MSGLRERVLRDRARLLARPIEPERPPGVSSILFRVAGQRYALPLAEAMRILPVEELSPLPGARSPLVGLAPWRGGLLPLVDLRLLGPSDAGPGIEDLTRIVVLGDDASPVGVLVESVEDVAAVDFAGLTALADEAADRRHIRGVTADAVLVLDSSGFLELVRGG